MSNLDCHCPNEDKDLSYEEEEIMKTVFGKRVCNDSPFSKMAYMLLLAVILTIVFIILNMKPVDDWFRKYVPDHGYRLITKALIFFVVAYIVDFYITRWKKRCNVCR